MDHAANGWHEGLMAEYLVNVEGRDLRVLVDGDGGAKVIGHDAEVSTAKVSEHGYSLIVGNDVFLVHVRRNGDAYEVHLRGRQLQGKVETPRERLVRRYGNELDEGDRRLEIRAPMPSLVLKVEVKVGDEVTAGQGLAVLEAMKMENELKAMQPGKVESIFVKEGMIVEKGELLLLLG